MAAVITSITGLQNLINLQNFNADWNALTTVNLSGLTNLYEVDISDNDKIDGSGDPSLTSVNLSGCVALQELRLDDSDFSAGIPNLAGLTSLTYIDMDQCSITGPLDLSMLSALVSFDLSNNTGLTSVTLPTSSIDNANLYGTALLPAVVNTILQQLDASGVIDGYVSMEDGTSAAATGAGITAISSLEAKGWQVYTNTPTTTTTTTTVAPTTTTTTTAAPAGPYYYEVRITQQNSCAPSFVDNFYSDVSSPISVWYNAVQPYPGAPFTLSYNILGVGTPGPYYADLTTIIQTVTPAGSCVA